jgi:hypothetical protein
MSDSIDVAVAEAVAAYDREVRLREEATPEFGTTRLVPNSAREHIWTLDDGRTIRRKYEVIDIPNDQNAARCATRYLLRVATRAPERGTVWFQGEPVHVVRYGDDQPAVLPGPDGFDVIRLRTVYYHEATAVPAEITARMESQ